MARAAKLKRELETAGTKRKGELRRAIAKLEAIAGHR